MHQNSGWENYIYVPAFMAASHLNPFVLISSQSFYLKKRQNSSLHIYPFWFGIYFDITNLYFWLGFKKGNYKLTFRLSKNISIFTKLRWIILLKWIDFFSLLWRTQWKLYYKSVSECLIYNRLKLIFYAQNYIVTMLAYHI